MIVKLKVVSDTRTTIKLVFYTTKNLGSSTNAYSLHMHDKFSPKTGRQTLICDQMILRIQKKSYILNNEHKTFEAPPLNVTFLKALESFWSRYEIKILNI